MCSSYAGTPELTCDECGASFAKPRQLSGHVIGKHVRRLGLKNASIRVESLSAFQIGYISAFLDGEGGIQITRTQRKDREYTVALHPTVYFTNTCRASIDAIRAWISVGTMVTTRTREGRKDMYVLRVTGVRNIE